MGDQTEKYYLIKPSDLAEASSHAVRDGSNFKPLSVVQAEILLEGAADIRNRKSATLKGGEIKRPKATKAAQQAQGVKS